MLQLNLPPDVEQSLTAHVMPDGFYQSVEEVVQAGLELLEAEQAALRAAIQVGIDDANAGRFCNRPIEELIAEARRRLNDEPAA